MTDYKRLVMLRPCALISHSINSSSRMWDGEDYSPSDYVYGGLASFISTFEIYNTDIFGDTNHLPQAIHDQAGEMS